MLFRRKKGIALLIQSSLIIAYAALNAAIPFLYVSGNTGGVLRIIKPLIPTALAYLFLLTATINCSIIVLSSKRGVPNERRYFEYQAITTVI